MVQSDQAELKLKKETDTDRGVVKSDQGMLN